MYNGNRRKAELLGEPFGTANSKLKKNLLFDFAKRLNEDICFRCQVRIEKLEDFSIEHKQSWMFADNPIEAFYDLNNIAFSHVICNIGAGSRNKIYESEKEKKHANYVSWYANPINRENHLERKRSRYRSK